MIERRNFLLLAGASLFSSPSFSQIKSAEIEAPLGLQWGASVEDLSAQGINLKKLASEDFGASFIAENISKSLTDQSVSMLSFGYNNKLWRLLMASRDFANDPHGNAVQSRYNKLLQSLTEKYGTPKSTHRLGDSIYAEPQYFLSGIRNGRSTWHSSFFTPKLYIELSIRASNSSTGYWSIIYQYMPLWGEFQIAKEQSEKNRLNST